MKFIYRSFVVFPSILFLFSASECFSVEAADLVLESQERVDLEFAGSGEDSMTVYYPIEIESAEANTPPKDAPRNPFAGFTGFGVSVGHPMTSLEFSHEMKYVIVEARFSAGMIYNKAKKENFLMNNASIFPAGGGIGYGARMRFFDGRIEVGAISFQHLLTRGTAYMENGGTPMELEHKAKTEAFKSKFLNGFSRYGYDVRFNLDMTESRTNADRRVIYVAVSGLRVGSVLPSHVRFGIRWAFKLIQD